ncbi:E3 ubiquitin-protein ligase TRIM56-like [Patella vulgata]|uniref:E3 ubiquitin-protein ligase TRIM56-like n=1 Tax=Patella vulgata TaxID=6465 RepID=UPI00217F3F26|nr:E3 ubiquitin-protein ligase TRIM56-like [Patella vulgata]
MAERIDKIICSICLNDFKQPKLIDCQHFFCLTCLEDYISKTSTNNRFPCPLCRQYVKVPEDGAGGFPATSDVGGMSVCINQIPPCDVCTTGVNAKVRCQDCQQKLCISCKETHDSFKGSRDHVVENIDDLTMNQSADPHSKDVCPNHHKRKARCYCKDCSIAVCSDCFITSHSSHKFIDLKDRGIVDQFREELRSLKDGLGDRISEFEKYCESIEKVIADINNSAKTSCETVDKQVEQIYCEIKELSEEIKGQIEKSRAEETQKLLHILGEMKASIGDLNTSVTCSIAVLDDKSIVKVIDKIPQAQDEKVKSSLRQLDIPDVKHAHFEKGVIDKTILLKHLGVVDILDESTFTRCFNLTELELTNSGYVYGTDYHISGQSWYLGIRKLSKDNNSTLGVYLFLRNLHNKNYSVQFALTLINTTRAKTVMLNGNHTYTGMQGYGFHSFIDWDKLKDEQNGYLDQNYNFIIKATVRVTKLDDDDDDDDEDDDDDDEDDDDYTYDDD